MTISELSTYIIQYPEVFEYNYFVSPENVTLDLSIRPVNARKQLAVMLDRIHRGCIGYVACLFDLGYLSSKNVLQLCKSQEDMRLACREVLGSTDTIKQSKCKPIHQLIDYYKSLETAYLIGVDISADCVKESLKLEQSKLSLHHRLKYRKLNKLPADMLTKLTKSAHKKSIDSLISNYASQEDVRFVSSKYANELQSAISDSKYANLADCMLNITPECKAYFESKIASRKSRIERLEELNAPPIILDNEKLIFHNNTYLYWICDQILLEKLSKDDAIPLLTEFFNSDISHRTELSESVLNSIDPNIFRSSDSTELDSL